MKPVVAPPPPDRKRPVADGGNGGGWNPAIAMAGPVAVSFGHSVAANQTSCPVVPIGLHRFGFCRDGHEWVKVPFSRNPFVAGPAD